MQRTARRGVTAGLALVALATGARGQELADFDYENLALRGIGVEWGQLYPSRVQSTGSLGLRMDLGYLGPGLRIVPGIDYWSSPFKREEVAELEDRVADLVADQTGQPRPEVNLGTIEWTDVTLRMDAHVVWRVPYDVLTFGGLGVAAHVLNGDGEAINGTFVEDLLDSVSAGLNLHAGLEVPVRERLRVYGVSRYEVLGDLQYFTLRLGAHLTFGEPAPGESAAR